MQMRIQAASVRRRQKEASAPHPLVIGDIGIIQHPIRSLPDLYSCLSAPHLY
jgi:hypothetical protein